jgi:apolipoprotein N-acyltransferase
MNHLWFQKFLFCTTCVFAGWIAAFSMPPASIWPCMFLGLSGLYWLYSKTSSAVQAFATGFFFALGYFVTGLWWIGNALLVEGNEFAWVWPISVIGLPTLLALFTGVYLAIARLSHSPDNFKGFLVFAFFLTFSEWTRGNAFTGFPWNLYGYVWADHLPMAQASHYIGAYGLTLVSVLWGSVGGYLFVSADGKRFKIVLASIATLTLAATYMLGQYRLDNSVTTFDEKTGIVVAQPNIPQNMKWDPVAVQENFLKISSLSKTGIFADPKPETIFIVWPETAISPAVYTRTENMDRIRDLLQGYTKSETYLVTGILRRMAGATEEETQYANSVVFLNKDMTALQAYDKHHLVPFGEFIPLQNWIPLKPVAAFRGFQRGSGPATVERDSSPAFSPLICYEIIFPDAVIDKHAKRPSWIVNVTNDGWYGDSAGPYQHFAQTRLRAIEEGLPVVRAANTGISGVIDPYGRVLEKADIFQEAVLVTHLPAPLPHSNPYWPWAFQVFLPLASLALMLRALLSRETYP